MRTTRFATGSVVLGLTIAAGILAFSVARDNTAMAVPSNDDAGAPESLQLIGVVRDFIEHTKPGGHPDFEVIPNLNYAVYNHNISPTLGSNGKPVYVGGGWKNTLDWKDSQNRPICYLLYNPALGDHIGSQGGASTGGITSGSTFTQWFNDVPGVNMSSLLTIKLNKQPDGSYVFDDKLDPQYDDMGGFFPIDGQLFGNSGGLPDHNFHFTYELHTQFTYLAGTGQMFKFIGDDDVFVYINGQLVIDLGGVHSARSQYVALDRLGLANGQMYPLDFFFAERHRTQSNCRIQTNLILNSTNVPSVTSAFD